MTTISPDMGLTLDGVAAEMQRLHDVSEGLRTHAALVERLKGAPLWVEEQLEILENAATAASAGLRTALSAWVREALAAEVRELRTKLAQAEDELLRAELTDVPGHALPGVDHDERREQRERAGELLDAAVRAVAAADEASTVLARAGR
jgi:hypothetical protein